MSSWMFGLVAVGMLVGCATPYGDAEPPETTAAITTIDKRDMTEKQTTAPPKPVAAEPIPTKTTVTAAPSSIAFTWNRVTDQAEYSLDVLLRDRETIGPCISVQWIHHELSTTFRGDCPSSDAHPTVAMDQIEGFQLCWAEHDDWAHAVCTHVMWDGAESAVTFDL